jgi:1-aminocyclopropane-1-carboxylate deaminase
VRLDAFPRHQLTLAGMIDLAGRGEIERGSTVLYAHLGGQPALSAYAAVVR